MKKDNNNAPNTAARKKTRTKLYILLAVLAVMLAVVLSFGYTASWFAPKSKVEVEAILTDIGAEMLYSYKTNAVTVKLNETDGRIKINTYKSSSNNNYTNLNLSVDYKDKSSAYIRVKLFESFFTSDGVLLPAPAERIPYNLAEGWSYNEDDGFYYYDSIVSAPENEESISIPFVITGTNEALNDTVYDTSKYYMNLVAVIEEVQPDRFEDFFGFAPEKLTAE